MQCRRRGRHGEITFSFFSRGGFDKGGKEGVGCSVRIEAGLDEEEQGESIQVVLDEDDSIARIEVAG